MIRRLLRLLAEHDERRLPPIFKCTRDGCYTQPHYHYGYGQRHASIERPGNAPGNFGGGDVRYAKGDYPEFDWWEWSGEPRGYPDA